MYQYIISCEIKLDQAECKHQSDNFFTDKNNYDQTLIFYKVLFSKLEQDNSS